MTFASVLRKIPDWNSQIVAKEYERIKKEAEAKMKETNNSDCDLLDDLIKAVFISNVRILSSIRKNNQPFELELPSPRKLIHCCYIECAKEFSRNAYLFSHKLKNEIEIHRNISQIRNIIRKSIKDAICKLIPVRNILRQYMGDQATEQDKYEQDEDGFSEATKKRLHAMVKKEIAEANKSFVDKSEKDKDTNSATDPSEGEEKSIKISVAMQKTPQNSEQSRKSEASKEKDSDKKNDSEIVIKEHPLKGKKVDMQKSEKSEKGNDSVKSVNIDNSALFSDLEGEFFSSED
jgi:hypothetical protein